jgi:hypothetical protein
MADLLIPSDIAERLLEVAQQENTPVNDLLRSMLDEHVIRNQHVRESENGNKKMLEFLGAFDDDVPDIDSNVRETLDEYYRKKFSNTDTD